MPLTSVSDNMIDTGILSSKIQGAIAVTDGSNLTGFGGVTKSASDPAVDTNPADGVGALWANTANGEMFVCTDATTGANVWVNVGGGSGNVQPWAYGGTIAGFAMLGRPNTTSIQKYSYTSDGNAVDHGNLNSRSGNGNANAFGTGAQSETHGYCMGGNNEFGAPGDQMIDKFAFSSNTLATDIGDMTVGRDRGAGISSSTKGFVAGGQIGAPHYTNTATIETVTYASDAIAVWGEELVTARAGMTGHSSETDGYLAGGNQAPHTAVEKFSTSSAAASVEIGNITTLVHSASAHSSETYAYIGGGYQAPNNQQAIQKFAFASSVTMEGHGNLSEAKRHLAGSSSTTYGYLAGGLPAVHPNMTNVIEKFAFSSNVTASDVGDLVNGTVRDEMVGTHY